MDFKNEKELEKFILLQCKKAITNAENQIYNVIDKHLNTFYGEYKPAEYIRTQQLLYSLVRTGIKKTGNGYEAEIYFDASRLNYPNPAQGKSGLYHDANMSSEEILDMTMQGSHGGSHGGWKDGTHIWDDSMHWLGDIMKLLVDELRAQGIPIK